MLAVSDTIGDQGGACLQGTHASEVGLASPLESELMNRSHENPRFWRGLIHIKDSISALGRDRDAQSEADM